MVTRASFGDHASARDVESARQVTDRGSTLGVDGRRQRLDSWTAVILGVAAILTAWASFQASQWSGAQSDAESLSTISRSDAGHTTTDATRAEITDTQTWQTWLLAVSTGA
jgi:hypothetical protein